MRKVIVGILSAVMILFMVNAGMAGNVSGITSGTSDYEAEASPGCCFSYTDTDGEANLGNGVINDSLYETGDHQSAYSGASQTVDSSSHGVGLFVDTSATGEAFQSTGALTDNDSDLGGGDGYSSGVAVGNQNSKAGYSASLDDAFGGGSSEGEAETSGSVDTTVNNNEITDGYSSYSSAEVENSGSASTETLGIDGSDNQNSYTHGSGEVESGTYTTGVFDNVRASAQSHGTASFEYDTSDEGSDCSIVGAGSSTAGSGYASTSGYSEVTHDSDGYHAESHHTSFSSSCDEADSSVSGSVSGVTNNLNVDVD